jgi:uncharacterized protein DUF5681
MAKMPSKASKATQAEPMIGRGNPPQRTRFVKGSSGNPKGRPKGRKNLATILTEAARGQVTATIDGKQRKITKIQATAMQLATKAAGGDSASIARFLDWFDAIEARAAAARPEAFPFSEADLNVLREVYTRMQLCEPALFATISNPPPLLRGAFLIKHYQI